MLTAVGLFGALALLIVLTIRGVNLLIAAPLCALIVALTSGLLIFPAQATDGDSFIGLYMNGFTGFIASWFFMFLLGALFGKIMEDTGAAESVSAKVLGLMGSQRAPLAIILACAVLTYGGVSLFVVAFSVYPLALSMFRKANLPRRFIPATIAFGSVTFTMTSAGSPEIQNWIPIAHLGTTPYAGWEVSLVVAIVMAALGYAWLNRMLRRAHVNGEAFEDRSDDPSQDSRSLPHPLLATLPLVVVLGLSFVLHEQLGTSALIVALLGGCVTALLVGWRYLQDLDEAISEGVLGALLAIGNTAAVVGFGTIAKASPAFMVAVDAMTGLPGNALIGAAVAVTSIAALTGSASGGQAIALPILAPGYLDQGVDPEQLHRVVAISSGALDSLPHNGYVVTTIRAICKETHQAAYAPMGALTVVIPVIGTILAIALFILF